MDIRQLEYFMACAETGSVSEAAKILYSTQPSVSKVLKSLEDSLGIRLFERLPRGIRLTPDGKKFYRHACRIVNGLWIFIMKTIIRIITFRSIRPVSVQ